MTFTRLTDLAVDELEVGGTPIQSADIVNKDADYTLTNADNGSLFVFSTAATLTVPAGLDVGFQCAIVQGGAGAVGIDAGAGVTVNNRSGFTQTAGQYALMSLIGIAADTFISAGDGA